MLGVTHLTLVSIIALWSAQSHSRALVRGSRIVNIAKPVNTTSGIVVGRTSPKSPSVVEYLGIRFAETTGGDNRFAPPKRYHGEDIITANKYAASCAQGSGGGIIGWITTYALGIQSSSEDCLFLNIWSRPVTNSQLRPVMIWIYGGAFTTGDGSMAIANGASLAADHEVLVVAPNYRVSAFGFPGAPELEHKNPGLLDQRLAVEWVRDNIAAFGGDPNRITLFGESAGGSSVDYYAYAWPDDPIVNGFIAQSGTAMMSDLFKPATDGSRSWYATTAKLGCGGAGTPKDDLLRCVRSKSVDEVIAATPSAQASGIAALVPGFAPTADERTVFSDIYNRARAGRFARKPLLIGSNQNESSLFLNIARIMQPLRGTDQKGAVHLENDFRCGTAEGAKARASYNVPVWRYLYANNARGSDRGATHGDEVGIVFGNEKSQYTGLFQDAWLRFVQDPVNGLSHPTAQELFSQAWPRYNSTGRTLVRIAPDQTTAVDFVESTMYDGNCGASQIK